ncbi:MAG TPA: RidA family protein [Xanthobacteraceae bacterium]|nr:RidA family protein [Xanthobacteraceae bacterium]
MAAVRFINPEGLVRPQAYTQVVEVLAPAGIVHVSGQLGTTADGKLVSRDFRAQAEQVFANIETALASVGAKFAHVVKISSFLTDMAHLPILREVRAGKLNAAALPASTTIEVSGFALAGALLEIEVIAVLPSGARRKAPLRKLKARRTRR